MYRIDRAKLEQLPPEKRAEAEALLAEYEQLVRANPLQGFRPHPANEHGRRPQLEFIQAASPIVAAFAGTRFGKSTVLGVCALREALPREVLPKWLAASKRFDAPTSGWILVPTEAKIDDSFRPVFEKWTPKSQFHGGSWGKAFNGATMVLKFASGSTVAFKTYKQDHSTLGGAALHYVGYDEPPPKKHREECMFRLVDYGGFEMFAMTPLDVNTGYVRREIYKKREHPDITVVSGSIHENPTLDAATRVRALGSVSDIYRQAREFGMFVDVGGLIYPEFENCVTRKPFDPAFIRTLDIVVGVDPGMRNAGIVWVGFDQENVAYVFDEALLQDKVVKDYAARIRATNSRWQLPRDNISYVCDPNARVRGAVDGARVVTALGQEEIYCALGQNDHETGFDQMRTRMAHKRFLVSPECRGLRDEADEYAGKEPEEGRDDSHLEPVKGNDHRIDACRYAVMQRFWDPGMEDQAPERQLGWEPGTAPAIRDIRSVDEPTPMGSMS